MEYSVRLSGDGLLDNIQTAYDRAGINATRAHELAATSDWLWGPEASYDDYARERPLHHQITGEIDRIGQNYRTEGYWMCTDPVAKELVPDFPSLILYSAQRYLAEAQDEAVGTEQRMVSLDYAKQYALTLFHAAQYPARTRMLEPAERSRIDNYAAAAEHATRAFYGSILGQDKNTLDNEVALAIGLLGGQEIAEHVPSLPLEHFKHQELDQPLTVLMSSLLAVNDYPDTDVIYALPAGGTQHAIVTRMLYGLKNPGRGLPVLQYLPISTHSVKRESLGGIISPSVELAIRQSDPYGKNVLICEDNSNSGTTVSLATDVVESSLPATCNVSIVEFDPKRLEVKNRNLMPSGHVANFEHPDFTTAVGIVPITTGKYPDAQMRKIAPLRRQRNGHSEREDATIDTPRHYDELPDEFMAAFETTYKDALRYCGDLYGYRNPYQVAASIVRRCTETGAISERPLAEKYTIVQRMAQAAIGYPHMPLAVRRQLADGQEAADYKTEGPWIRAGSFELIHELLEYAEDSKSQVLIWTKGDGSYYSNPPYVGAEEQQQRFSISGLEAKFQELGFFDSGLGSFLAHPKKTALLGTRVLPDIRRRLPHITDVVIIDDSEKNLAEAGQAARRYDYTPHPINPLVHDTDRTRLDLLAQLCRERHWGSNAAFIIDMDDTLLHEKFRKYHQPRNMALTLLDAT